MGGKSPYKRLYLTRSSLDSKAHLGYNRTGSKPEVAVKVLSVLLEYFLGQLPVDFQFIINLTELRNLDLLGHSASTVPVT